MAVNQPLLFENVLEQDLLAIRSAGELLIATHAVVELIRICEIDEESAIRVSEMTFMEEAKQIPMLTLLVLADFAEIAQDDFPAFLDHQDVPGDFPSFGYARENYLDSSSAEIRDLFLPLLQVTDPEAAAIIDTLRWFGGSHEQETLRIISRLGVYYPEVFSAFMDTMAGGFSPFDQTAATLRLAEIDAPTAARVASMPFVGHDYFLTDTTLILFEDGFEADIAAVNSLLDQFEEEGGAQWTDLPDVMVQLIAIIAPDIHSSLASAEWVSDGVRANEVGGWDERRQAIYEPSRQVPEDEAMTAIAQTIYRGHSEYLPKLLEKSWFQDSLTGNEALGIGNLISLATDLNPETYYLLLDMQFLEDDLTVDDRLSITAIKNLARHGGDDFASLFNEVLDHPRIGGELTDSNIEFLEAAIEDALE